MQLRRKKKITAGKVLTEIVLALALILVVVPILWVFMLSLKSNTEIYTKPLQLPENWLWSNYVTAFKMMKPFELIGSTLVDEIGSLGIGIGLATLAAFAISRMRFGSGRLQNTMYTFFLSGTMIPGFVVLIPLFIMFAKAKITDTYWALILPHAAWMAPMNILMLVGAFNNIPIELDESVAIDGGTPWQILTRVNLPLVVPTLVTLVTIQFIYVWNDFFLSLIMINSIEKRTIAMASAVFKSQYTADYGLMTAGLVILMLPLIILFMFLQKYVVDGMVAGAVKG